MNQLLIAKYLQLLRRQYGYTQDGLAAELNISRQAVSKWETGNNIPDLEVLLKISKLYKLSINEILEPEIEEKSISSFEQIVEVEKTELERIFSGFTSEEIVKASIGTSPDVNDFLTKLLPHIDFKKEQERLGRIRIDEVEEIHNQVVSLCNLSSCE